MAPTSLNTIRILFRDSLKANYPNTEIESIFRLTIEHLTQIPFNNQIKQNEYILSDDQIRQFQAILGRLQKNEPVQYIFGKAHFYDLELFVNQHVLIPRQETEMLVHEILKYGQIKQIRTILDIGTGSGCIAISLKKNLLQARVFATDFSDKALKVAGKNASANKAEIHFFNDTILSPQKSLEYEYDLIVSNPPYVRESEKKQMHANVKDYEPSTALFVPDASPLIFYEAIAKVASSNLTANGLVAVEINEALAEETAAVFRAYEFRKCKVIKDLNNKDRILFLNRK